MYQNFQDPNANDVDDNDIDEVDDVDTDDDGDDGQSNEGDRDKDQPRKTASQRRAERAQKKAANAYEERLKGIETMLAKLAGGVGNEPSTKDKKDSEPVDVARIREEIERDVTAKVMESANAQIKVTRAISALEKAGYKGNPERGVRQILDDLEDLEVDNGRVDADALADIIDSFIEDSPELFRRRSRKGSDDEDFDSEESDRSRGNGNRSSARANREGYGPRDRSRSQGPKNPLLDALQKIAGASARER